MYGNIQLRTMVQTWTQQNLTVVQSKVLAQRRTRPMADVSG